MNNNLPELPEGAVLISSIKGMEQYGRYCITQFGELYSCTTNKRNIFSSHWRMMKNCFSHNGYYRLGLYSNTKNIPKGFFIHVLVAKAFIPNPENKPEINHKDLNKINNHVSNLEWVTKSENIIHSFLNGHHPNNKGELHGMSKLKDSDIIEIFKMKSQGIKQKDIASTYGVSDSTISQILSRIKFKHVAI